MYTDALKDHEVRTQSERTLTVRVFVGTCLRVRYRKNPVTPYVGYINLNTRVCIGYMVAMFYQGYMGSIGVTVGLICLP